MCECGVLGVWGVLVTLERGWGGGEGSARKEKEVTAMSPELIVC